MGASVIVGFVVCLTLNIIGGVSPAAAATFPEACADPDVQMLIDVQNACTSANDTCNVMMPVSPV